MYGYDEVPYESHCYVLTHPARLGAMARLFGVAAAGPATPKRMQQVAMTEAIFFIPLPP